MKRPPEARLIYGKREQAGLSIREAARRAGISEGSWRRTESGRDLVRTPGTVARMAQVTGITGAQLRAAGRGDAAAELEALPPLAQPGSSQPVTREDLREIFARLAELSARVDAQNPRGKAGPGEANDPARRRA